MIDTTLDSTGWSALVLGAFTVFAAIGAFRNPGVWQKVVKEIESSPALQLISGMLELVAGTTVYLLNPWIPADILTCVMKTLGALMVFEALMVIGFSDVYFHFWLRNLSHLHRPWVAVTFLCGLALTLVAFWRAAS
ncbi:hypothetical protein GCM10022213_12470 [Parerythrobacter jejuensis]